MRKSFNSSQDNHSPVQLAEQTSWCAGTSWERGERQPCAGTLPHPSLLRAGCGLRWGPQSRVGALALADPPHCLRGCVSGARLAPRPCLGSGGQSLSQRVLLLCGCCLGWWQHAEQGHRHRCRGALDMVRGRAHSITP